MPLETATYVSELVASNPAGGDLESQGDDHLRLIKATLQATFPNANRARYFRHITTVSSNYSALVSDDQTLLVAGAALTVTLPTGSSVYAGFELTIISATSGTVTIAAASGDTINGGASTTITSKYEVRVLTYTGTEWLYQLAPAISVPPASDSLTYDQLAIHPDEREYNMGLDFSGDGWDLAGGAVLETYNASGVPANAPAPKVVKFDHSAAQDQSLRQRDYVPVRAGGTYEITIDVARSGASVASNVSVLLYPRWLTAGKTLISIDSTSVGDEVNALALDTWGKISRQFVAPAGAAYLDLKFFGYNYNNPSSAVVRAANYRVRPAVGGDAIESGAVTAAKIAAAAVGTTEISDDAVTLAKLASGTAGEMLSYNAAGDPTTLAVGAAGSILTSNGAGATPSWQSLAKSLASSGYITLAGGLIFQWIQIPAANRTNSEKGTVTWPIAFPNAIFGAWASAQDADTTPSRMGGYFAVYDFSTTGASWMWTEFIDEGQVKGTIFAIGN